METKTQLLPRHAGFIASELHTYSREIIEVAEGQNLRAGTVLGAIGGSGATAGHFARYDGGESNGTEDVAGILIDDVDATDAVAEGVAIVRGPCEVHEGRLVWNEDQEAGEITAGKAALAALGIVLRS